MLANPAFRVKRHAQAGLASIVRQVVAEAHDLAMFAFFLDEPDAGAPAQTRNECKVALVPLHDEFARLVLSIQLEIETCLNRIETVFAQNLLDDFRKAQVQEEPAFRGIAQEREARFEYDFISRLVAIAGKLVEGGNDALNLAARAIRRCQAGQAWWLNCESGGAVQIIGAGQIGQRMRERDCKAPRLADRFDAIEAHDTHVFRAGCAWYVEKIGFVK